MSMPADPNVTQLKSTRTTRFAQFLRAAVAIKTKTVAEVNKYPTVVWFANLPSSTTAVRTPLLSDTWDADDVRWLVVSRVTEPDVPRAPEVCKPWLEGVDLETPQNSPVLNASHAGTNETGEEVQLEPTNEAREQWEAYLAEKWRPWAERAAMARQVRPIYQKLFAAYQEMQGREDAYDLFIGVGLLHARSDPNQPLRRHLLSFPAELSFDSKTGTFTASPAADFDHARVEQDFLPAGKRAVLQKKIEEIESALHDVGSTVQNRADLGSIMSTLVHSLDADYSYVDELAPQDAAAGKGRASFAPALIMRPRSTRSIDELLARIERDSSGDSPTVSLEQTSTPWRRLLEDEKVWDGMEPQENGPSNKATPQRVYFPLPSNEEQSRIVKYASGTAGVVVQGPPGTGKSHTIANLISHYLATGKRVLVTAQTAQALEVLRDKLPKDLQTLCVSLLGATSASDKELQRSVKGILSRRQEVDDPRAYEREAARLEAKLLESEVRLVSLERILHDARVAETEVLEPVTGYRGTRSAIARRLNDERPMLGWIQDEIAYDVPCSTYAFGWERLGRYHRSLDDVLRRRLAKVCVEIPFDRAAATEVVQRIAASMAAMPLDPVLTGPPLPAGMGPEVLTPLVSWLEGLQTAELEASPENRTWLSDLRSSVLRNDLASWHALRSEAAVALSALPETVVADTRKVRISSRRTAAEARRDLERLSAYYRAGGKRRTLWVFKRAVVRETEWIERGVQLEGALVRAPADVDRALRALVGWACLDAAWGVWARWPTARGGSPPQQVATLRNRLLTLEAVLALGPARESLSIPLRQWLTVAASNEMCTEDMLLSCRRRLAEALLASARADRDHLVTSLEVAIGNSDVVPGALQLREALLAEDLAAVRAALLSIDEETQRREVHAHYLEFLETVDRSAPNLARAIAGDEGSDRWGARFLSFGVAWSHRRASVWLKLVLSKEDIEVTDRATRDERSRAQDLLRNIAVARAWNAALERIDDRTRASLVGWTLAVANIPATGKSVFRRRAVARRSLGKCLDAIPAWVVSLGRLYETIDARPGMFDIAIVDEASQCWLDSLVLFYLAKQIIIVGDDKQISPTVVGVTSGEVEELAEVYLPDLEHRGGFTIDSSLFDHAQRYLPAGVPLQEHFRCVPEIIRFSNELCYTDRPLIPLRQCGRDRLEPLKITFLPSGLRHGDMNEVEAKAIVDAIVHCNADDAYEEADFGVICLQGDDQALRIQQLLLERLGPGVFEKRNLRCGNPYAFQGDERNIIFLSMVAAPNANNAPLTTRMYEQRFNVALSRARDQMWLFHSILEQDLSPRCLRRRVLEFFRQPPDLSIQGSPLNIPQLQLLAVRANRRIERPPTPFESWFELDVALALAARGYTLSAQVQVAKKRIDLVVEGDGTRLAVECDGEACHGPEQFVEDNFRQWQLERAGWHFARIRESLFYTDADAAIVEVIAACQEQGIEPGGHARDRAARRPSPDAPVVPDVDGGVPETHGATAEVATGVTPAGTVVASDERDQEADEDVVGQSREVPYSTPHTSDADLSTLATDDVRDGPFSGYGSKNYPDPRTAPPSNIRDAVLDICSTDGPLPKASIYRLYRDGCQRVERAGKNLRQAVNRAVAALERLGLIESRDEGRRRDPVEVVVKLPSQPWVNARPPGRRGFEDVPLSELAAAMTAINGQNGPTSEAEKQELYRRVARKFNLQRLRPQWFPRLEMAEQMAFNYDSAAEGKLSQ
jgi:very-short-patch-repair endonuclease